jgi:3-phenylpropionate/trans-cinnamate dioxygenase ferredoxin subunit
MTEATEVRVCSVGDVEPGTARRVDVNGFRLCVVRIADDWYVIGDECSHADYSLSEGDVWEDEREIECPKHGSTFSLETGEPQTLPATQPVPVFGVRVAGDDVLVSVGGEAPGPSGPARRAESGPR